MSNRIFKTRTAISMVALAGALTLLGGCAYQLTLTSALTLEPVATGTATKYGKIVSISLDRQTYTGHYQETSAGPVTLASYAADMPTPAGFVVGVSGSGDETVTALNANQQQIRCVFSFGVGGKPGAGQCVTQTGRVFTLAVAGR